MNIVKEKDCCLNILPIVPYSCGKNNYTKTKGQKISSGCSFGNNYGVITPQLDTFIQTKGYPNIKTTHFYRTPKIKRTPKPAKFTIQDYKNLSKTEKEFISENIPNEIKELAMVNVGVGIALKQAFDDKYSEGNYKFISLGTSPALTAKVMELMGADVVYLPMSYAHTTCTKHWLQESPYIHFYKGYMENIGLTNENLRKENKRGIICDYTVSGRSLELSEFMLKGPLGLDESLLDTYTMNNLIQNSPYIQEDVKDRYLNELLKKEKAADYCDVPHFSFIDKKPFNSGKINSSKSLITYFEDYRAKSSNPYNFSVMKILEDENLLS